MPIITISRETGASGTYIALKLAEKLKCNCFDQQVIHDIAEKMGKNRDQLEDFDQQTYSRVGVFFQEALASIAQGGMVFHPFGIGPLDWDSAEMFSTFPRDSFHEKDYFEVLNQVVKEIAEAKNAVILGRGAAQILKDCPEAIHIRIVAEKPDRIKHVMSEQNLDEPKAAEIVRQKEESAANFIYDFFDTDWNDAHSYHLILNTSKITPDDCIEFIMNAIDKKS